MHPQVHAQPHNLPSTDRTVQQLASFTQGVHAQVNPGGERPNRVRACLSCNKQDHIAAACPQMPRKLQDKRSRKGIHFAEAVSVSDRQAQGSFRGFFCEVPLGPAHRRM